MRRKYGSCVAQKIAQEELKPLRRRFSQQLTLYPYQFTVQWQNRGGTALAKVSAVLLIS
jgi:hypothetical protein